MIKIEEIRSNLFASLIVGLSLIVKMGLFPGHVWGIYIYNSASIPAILILSSIAKLAPLVLMLMWSTKYINEKTQAVIFFCIILSYAVVVSNLWESRNLFSFIFFSGLFHIRNRILIIIMGLLPFFFLYFLRYVLILLSFVTIFYHFNIDNLQRDHKFTSNGILTMHIMRVSGFPPFPLFWYKLLIFYKLWESNIFIRNISFIIVIVIFIYLITLFMYIIKGWDLSKNYTTDLTMRGHVHSSTTLDRKFLLPHFMILFMPIGSMSILL